MWLGLFRKVCRKLVPLVFRITSLALCLTTIFLKIFERFFEIYKTAGNYKLSIVSHWQMHLTFCFLAACFKVSSSSNSLDLESEAAISFFFHLNWSGSLMLILLLLEQYQDFFVSFGCASSVASFYFFLVLRHLIQMNRSGLLMSTLLLVLLLLIIF